MSKQASLPSIAAHTNPDSLVLDQRLEKFVRLPAALEPFADALPSSAAGQTASQGRFPPCIRLVPELNPDQAYQTGTGLELVNTVSRNFRFVSEHVFTGGVHEVELVNLVSFKNVKVKLLRTNSKGKVSEFPLSLDGFGLAESVVATINIRNKLFSVYSKALGKSVDVPLKGSRFRLAVELKSIGDFVSVNPMLASNGFNRVWRLHMFKTDSKFYELSKDWFFFPQPEKPEEGHLAGLYKEVTGRDDDPAASADVLQSEKSGFLAIRAPQDRLKAAKEVAKAKEAAPRSLLKRVFNLVFNSLTFDGQLQHTALIDFIGQNKERFLEPKRPMGLSCLASKVRSQTLPALERTYAAAGGSAKAEVLPESDLLLLFNGINKIKLVAERSRKGEFVVNPFVFDTSRVNFYLTKAEFGVLFVSLDWERVEQLLHLTSEEAGLLVRALESLADPSSIATDGEHYFVAMDPRLAQVLVEKVFAYLNLATNAIYPTEIADAPAGPAQPDKPTEKGKEEEDSGTEHGLIELFDEDKTPLQPAEAEVQESNPHRRTYFNNPFESFPTEFDALMAVLFKVEEALFLQSDDYRKAAWTVGRSHTALGRIFSFVGSTLPLHQVKRLADFGLYINSAFAGHFRNFQHEVAYVNDFNDQNVAELYLRSYAAHKTSPHGSFAPADNIPLAFSVSHLPAWTCPDRIEQVFQLEGGRFVGVVTENKSLYVLSTHFGPAVIYKSNLTAPVNWTAPKQFEHLIKNDIADVKDLEPVGDEPEEPESQDKNAKAALPPAPKPEDMDKVIDKGMLDQLYNMGFPLELCRMALFEVKSASLEEAINQVLKMKEEKTVPAQPTKTKVLHYQLKPEWECKVCTLANVVDYANPTPDICEACGNVADQDAYFEEEEEEIVSLPPIEPERQFKSEAVVEPSDYVVAMDLVGMKKDNLLHRHFLVLLVRRLDKFLLVVSRLAVSEGLIRHLALQEPRTKAFASWPGFKLLKKGAVEREIGQLFTQFYEEKALSVLPTFLEALVLTESSRKTFSVEIKDEVAGLFSNPHSSLNARGSEEIQLYLSGPKLTQIVALSNKSRNYCSNDFELQLVETVEAPTVRILGAVDSDHLVAVTDTHLIGTNSKLVPVGTKVDLPAYQRILATDRRGVHLLLTDNKVQRFESHQSPFLFAEAHLQKAIQGSRTKQSGTLQNDFISPQVLLSFFKTQSTLPFRSSKLVNLINHTPASVPTYALRVLPIQSTAPSALALKEIGQPEGCNLNLDLYVRLPKATPAVQSFLVSIAGNPNRPQKTFSNVYTNLELRSLAFYGTPFSKSTHISQMLAKNGEYFSTKHPFHLFVFESAFEKVLKVKKVVLEVSPSMRASSLVDEVLVFVFSDLALTHAIADLADLTLSTVETGLKNNSMWLGTEPCCKLSLKGTEDGRVAEELELARSGRYIAFLPLKGGQVASKSAKKLDCFQYFGVEGEYEEDSAVESLVLNGEPLRQGSNSYSYSGLSLQIQNEGVKRSFDSWNVIGVQETHEHYLTKLRGNLSLAGPVSRLHLELPGSTPDFHVIAANISLSNISHSLVTKIREQLETGASEKLVSIFRQFNSRILGGLKEGDAASESAYLSLVDLLLFILETFDLKAVSSVQEIDFRSLIRLCVLNSADWKIIGASRFLIEKLFGLQASQGYFQDIFSEVLSDLPQKGLTRQGLESLWKLLAKFVETASPQLRKKTLRDVYQHLGRVVSRTEALNTPNVMLLRSLGLSDSLSLAPDFKAETRTAAGAGRGGAAGSGESTAVEAVSAESLVDWNGQSFQEKNYAEFFINCTEVVKLSQILVRFPSVKPLLHTTLEVQVFNAETEAFEVVKVKQLGPDFSNYLSSKELSEDPLSLRHFHLGLNFACYDKPVKLLKVVARINHIPVFDYTDPDSTKYLFFVYGTPVVRLVAQAGIPADVAAQIETGVIQTIVRKSNSKFAALDDEISAVPNLKPKWKDLGSTAIYEKARARQGESLLLEAAAGSLDKEGGDSPASSQAKQIQDSLQQLKDSIEEQLQAAEVSDFKPKSALSATLTTQVESFRSTLESNKSKLADPANFNENLTFWLTDLSLFVQNLGRSATKEDGFAVLKDSGVSLDAFLARLFFDGYFFNTNVDKDLTEAFLADLLRLLGPEEPVRLLTSLCATYQATNNAVFVANLDKFVDSLRVLKLNTTLSWPLILREIHSFADRKPEDLTPEDLKRLLLNCCLFNNALMERGLATPELLGQMEATLVWLLDHHLESVNKKFEETALVMVTQVFKLLAPGQEDSLVFNPDALKRVLELTAKNGMLAKVDKVIADFVRLVNKVSSKSAEAKRFKTLMQTLKQTLIGFVTEQVLESDATQVFGAERVSEILFFALSHIKSVDEVQTSLAGEREEELAAPATPAVKTSAQPPLAKDASKKGTKERSGSFTQMPTEGDTLLSTFVNDILKYMSSRSIQDNALISIIANFAITETVSPQLLFGFVRFALTQPTDIRQNIIQELGLKVADIHRKLKGGKSKAAVREFSSLTVDLLVEVMRNHLPRLVEDPTVAHFAITLTLHIIHENEAKAVTNEACKLALRPQLIAPLFAVTANILAERFNFGGPENFQNFLDADLLLFELVTNCLHIVVKGVDDSGSSLLTYFIQNFKSLKENAVPGETDVDSALEALSVWAMCNYAATFPELKTVVGPLLKKLHGDVVFLLGELFKKEEAGQSLLNHICSNFRRLNAVLTRKVEKRALGYQAAYLSENSIDFLESILKIVAEAEGLAHHFLIHNKGLELIFEILHRNSGETASEAPLSPHGSSLLAQMKRATDQAAPGRSAADLLKTVVSPVKDKALFEEEFGAKIVNVQVDKAIGSGSAVKDWCANKSGKVGSIYNTAVPLNRKSITLRFKANEDFELRTMRLSVSVSRSENYLVVGPVPYVHLYALQEDEKKEVRRVFLGELKRLNDPGYLQNLSVVYALNVNKMSGKDFGASLEGLRYAKELREFELVVGRPLFTVVDRSSPLVNRAITAVNFSINFLSVEGFTHAKVDIPTIFKARIQNSFYRFLEIIFNADHFAQPIDEYFDGVNRDRHFRVYELVESQLGPIMANFEEKMAKLLMVLSQKNKKLADSIFSFLLKNIDKKHTFFFMIERIAKNSQTYRYIFGFYDHCRRRMSGDVPHSARFLMVLSNFLTHLLDRLGKEARRPEVALPVDDKFFRAVLDLQKKAPFNFQVERFIVLVIHLLLQRQLFTVVSPALAKSESYILESEEKTQDTAAEGRYLLDLMVEKTLSGDLAYLHLIASLAQKSEYAKQAVVSKNLVGLVASKLATKEADLSLEILLFVQTVSDDPDLYRLLLDKQVDQRLLECLEENLRKKAVREDQDLINVALKTIFVVFKHSDAQIGDLEDVLFKILKRNKDDSFFIEKVLLKFFEFELTRKACFVPRQEAEVGGGRPSVGSEPAGVEAQQPSKSLQLKSSHLTNEHLTRLAGNLPLLVDQKTDRSIRSCEWKKIVETHDGGEDFSAQFEPQMYNKRPSLIVMNLDNSGAVGYLGMFVPEGFVKYADPADGIAYVPNSDNTFLFWYSESTFVHYKPGLDACDKFLRYTGVDGGKSLVFTMDDSEKIYISMNPDNPSTVDLYQMKPVQADNNPNFEFPYDCLVNGIEIFQLELKSDEKTETANQANKDFLGGKYLDKLAEIDFLGSFFGDHIFSELPEQLSLKALKSVVPPLLVAEELKGRLVADLPAPRCSLDVAKEVSPLLKAAYQTHYTPKFPVFEVFLSRGGIQYVIETVKNNENIPFLKEKNHREIWRQLMDDLIDLQSIEGFLGAMTQSKDFLPVLFELFIGGSKSTRNWEEAEFAISNLMFDKLASILKNSDSLDMRFAFFEKNVLRKLLDKLRALTYDNVRTFREDAPAEPQAPLPVPALADKDEPLLKEVKKRKGVGYEKEGSGKKFMVNEYLAKKKLRNEFIVSLLKLFKNLFSLSFANYKPGEARVEALRAGWFRTIAESSLLPMLESAFKCSSLHEMSKESEVYDQYCEVVLTLGRQPELRPLVLQLPPVYKPVQLESLAAILKKQEENTILFKSFAQSTGAKGAEGEDKMQSIELANLILDTIDQLKALYPEEFNDAGDEEYETLTDADLTAIQQLPVNDQYKISFKNLRFDLVDFKKPNEAAYEHHYASNISSDSKSSAQARMVRLAQEIADLSSSLPIDSYNAITVRADVNRLDVIKSMIAGAENTPYAHGLFEYHVYLPPEYPAGPPKCNLETTGSGDVRFNPNLYSCGKVCLSLLGTWRGSASENWDPKISNLLQLFLSIQSVVMSEEVYFNEPGYEGEAGTEEGEKKNEGYSNIVRLNNIKHAMIKQIKTPPVGFEDVVRRHFYIKRHVILKEVGRWVKFAEIRPCTYSGLVSDHNNKYASRFSSNNKTYLTELKTAISDLEKALKQLVEASDPHHIFAAKRLLHGKGKARAKPKPKAAGKNDLQTVGEQVDTTWDDIRKSETFDANDRKVADRWSRYIGAMGIEAVKKQSTAKVAVVGLNPLGLEIAKNIVLSGVHTLTLVDWRKVEANDLLGNFYAEKGDVGANRAACVKGKIQQLNFYVKVEELDLEAKPTADFVGEQTVLVIADNFLPKTQGLIAAARDKKVKVVIAETVGVFARVFVDFGAAFVVNDRDGEDPSECYIKGIDYATNTITLFDKSFNQLRDGDFIVIEEAETSVPEGAGELLELNGSIHKIRQMKRVTEIEVEDLSKFRHFQRNGKIKELKVPITHAFRDYAQLTPANQTEFLDENLAIHDFTKLEAVPLVSQCFLLKEKLERESGVDLRWAEWKQLEALLSDDQRKDEKLVKKLAMFWASAKGALHSLDAFLGGMVSQEAIIGITGKFTPIKQLFCTDVEEVLRDELRQSPEGQTQEVFDKDFAGEGKYARLSWLTGKSLLAQMKDSRLFMVGAGAIGCELLKNLAMVGLGCGPQGTITLTDPDSIELSNLNRQFLFREKHISKPKSLVAGSVVQTMNPDYQGKIVARLEKVCDESEEIYTDEFIQRQSICLNALDNVKARIYMDQRCVKNHVPLLESGTLGPKGHVQVIVPGVTENYAQVRDANEEHNIPVCTLKMFPEEPVHCMEWAKDRFEVLFAQNPKSVERVLEEFKAKGDVAAVYAKIKKAVLKMLRNRPKNAEEAVAMARKFYQKNFSNKIQQLLHVYPLDFKTKEGKLFWTLPKRPPGPRQFSLADPLDSKYIDSYARLLCRIWGLEEKLPEGGALQEVLDKVPIEPFKPKDSDAAKIKKDVEKMEKKEPEQPKEEEAAPANDASDETALNHELNALLKALDVDSLLKSVKAEVFEKDNDANNHIDLIYSLSALRSRNYKLPEMDWMATKLKAGRIVPALATTTATIAALQTIEAIKLVKKSKVEELKNCFLNLAIPNMTLSEPGPAAKFKIHDSLTVTVWDRWDYAFTQAQGNRFADLLASIESTHKLHVVDVLKDNKPIFLSTLNDRKAFDKMLLGDLLELDQGETCYLSVICKLEPTSDKALTNLPLVRVSFK